MTEAPNPLAALSLDALKGIGKTLGLMNLYQAGHPAVVASLKEAAKALSGILSVVAEGEVAYSIDGDKVIANGRIIGTAAQVPNAVVNLFNRFRLHSVAFRPGLTDEELMALCELAALRPDAAQGVDPVSFLAERGVGHVALNEAIYAKVDKDPEAPAALAGAAPPGPEAAAPAQVRGERLEEALAGGTLEQSIEVLVREAAPPEDRPKVYQMVMGQLRRDVERRIAEATETLRREKTVVENEQVKTQAVLTNMAEGVVVVDDSGRVLMMNPAAEALYGVRLVDVAGKPLSGSVREEHLLTMATEIATPQDRALEPSVDVISTEDTRRTLRSSAAVVQNEAGKTVGMVSVLSDVAKHKEFERMEREFVAHVTHELRAPLSSIRASLDILQGQLAGRLGEENAKILVTAVRNTDRLEELIRNILDFSRLESGQMTVHPQPADPERIAREAAESLQPWSVRKGVRLELEADPGLRQVSADPGRTVQVLVNLLSNAIKFTPAGGRIGVRVKPGASPQERFVEFSVSDTGPGIAKEDHKRVFEKFVQIVAGERHPGGTGLGLAIAKALIQMQNGQMWLDSDAGRGATFFFTLPVHSPPREPAAPSKPAPRAWWRKLLGL